LREVENDAEVHPVKAARRLTQEIQEFEAELDAEKEWLSADWQEWKLAQEREDWGYNPEIVVGGLKSDSEKMKSSHGRFCSQKEESSEASGSLIE
jgi:hypothetical protein